MFACLAAVVAVGTNLQATPVHAAEVSAIQGPSITISNETRPGQQVLVNDTVRIEANWSIPDQTGNAGDTFTLGLPTDAFEGKVGSFNLTPDGQQAPVYGTCEVEKAQVRCTLSAEVEGKNNVGGRLWFTSRAHQEYNNSNVTFMVNGNTPQEVPLPEGAQGIGYDPFTPQELMKLGYFIDDDTLTWRIVIPGKALADQSQLTIHDPYGTPGTNFTVEGAWFYKVPNTPKCWNNLYDPQCRTELWSKEGAATDGVTVNYDDALDKVVATVGAPFQIQADQLYTLHLDLKVDGTVVPGSEFENNATVNGQVVTATATKEAAGGGTGQGDAVGHIQLVKKLDGANTVPADTVFPVKFSFERAGQPVTGTLELKADGTPVMLRNIVNGTQVTLTEELPTVGGNTFGDPVFSGDGVVDGGDNSATATVTAQGTRTLELTLTNPVENPPAADKVVVVSPTVTPGTCEAGSPTPTEPTVEVPTTEGITYGQPQITHQGANTIITVKATPAPGKAIDPANLPNGWELRQDGTATFTAVIQRPDCGQVVVPVAPTYEAGVCAPGEVEPGEPTLTDATTEGIDYASSWAVDNDEIVVTATATAKRGFVIDKNALPADWTWNDDKGLAEYTKRYPKPVCAKLVVPVSPTVTPGVCTPGSATPADPTVELATTEGITYGAPEITVQGDQATVKVIATRKDGFLIDGGNLPQGWVYNNDGTATFTTTVQHGPCDATIKVVPVTPTMTAGVCEPGSPEATLPRVTTPTTEGITYSSPALSPVPGKKAYEVIVTATPNDGYRLDPDNLPAGWTMNANGQTANFNGEIAQPDCGTVVVPVAPTYKAGLCQPGSAQPGAPEVTPATTEGIDYTATWAEDGDEVVVTATATAKQGFVIDKNALPADWTWNNDKGIAEYTKRHPKEVCAKLVVPVSPKVTPGVCEPGATEPTNPTVELATTEGLTYGDPEFKVDGAKVVVTVTATRKDGFLIDGGNLPEGWVYNNDGTATFTTTVDKPVCDVPTPPAPSPSPSNPPAPSPSPTPSEPPAQADPVKPVAPKITPGSCKPGSSKPVPPTVEVPKVPGLKYGEPVVTVHGGKFKVTVTVTPEAGKKVGELGKGWTLNPDGTATFTHIGSMPVCGKKPGLPKTGS